MTEPLPETTWSGMKIEQPEVICWCDLFGQGQLVVSFLDTEAKTRPIPNRWIRFWTRIFFNSKWTFEDQAQSR
jgi:hypothetical protein